MAGLSENSLFAVYTFNDDSNFWKKCWFDSKKLVQSKKITNKQSLNF